MEKVMLSFHNDPAIKKKYVDRVKMHQELDHIAKGVYFEDSGNGNIRACGVGCTIEGSDHSKYETELGIPKEIAYLEDAFFEDMPDKDAMKWPLKFLEAVPVGVDLSKVTAKFVIWQFEDEKYGLKNIKEAQDDKEVLGFCEEVVALYKRTLAEEVSQDEFYDLYVKIDEAGGAWAWAWARAWAWAGAGGAWAWAEYENRILICADKLLELIKESK